MKIVPKDTYVATNYQNWLSPFVYLRPRYFYPSLNILKTEKKYSRPSLSLKLFKIETYFYEKITQTFSLPTVNVYRVRFLSFFYLLFLFSSFHNSNESKLPIERKQNSTSFSLPLFSFFFSPLLFIFPQIPPPKRVRLCLQTASSPPPSLARGSLLPPHTFSVKTKPREKSVSQPASRLLESHPRRDEGRKKKNTLVEEEARRWNRGEEGGGRGSVEKKAARRTVVWTGDERLSSHMHAMAQRFASCLVLLCWKKKKKEKRLPDFFSPRMEQPSIIRKLLLVFYRVCVSRIIVTDFFVKSKNRDKLRNTAWWSIVHWKNAKNESTIGFLGR